MKKTNFNKEWKFSLNDGLDWDAKIEKWDSIVDLPHDFSFVQPRRKDAPSGAHGGFFQGGVGKYQKSFKSKKNKKYFLICDGAYGLTDVYVNANVIYTNKYGYNSFYVDITDYIRYDKENEVLFRVNNTLMPNTRWYSGSGIYRDVFLCECENAYIHPFGSFVYTENIFGKTAYMNVETYVYSDKKAEGVLEFQVFDDKTGRKTAAFSKYVALSVGENKINAKFQIDNVKMWDVDTPNMYRIKTELKTEFAKDTDESAFGVRIINVDSKRGFMLNGKSVKLRGGCVHHDQGLVGSATYKEIEYRRIAKLKEAGFNAVRCSHNPQSQHFYEACDRLGMLVMDELFDYWTEGKKESDFHFYFKENWEMWAQNTVMRNRCHPSIVMWSTGNEIPQKTGRGNGYYIATDIANKIRSLDTSRPVTHALCSLWDNKEEYECEKRENDFPPSKLDCFAKKTAITADTTDIVGYNYLEYRLEKDLERFPKRVIINTETFSKNAYTTIKQLLNNPRIAGDFVWTAWDYFGETGIGHVEYDKERGDFLLPHPYYIANCGDIDICGVRKPQSYYREIAWGLRTDPYIAVRNPMLTEIPCFLSGWGFYDCEHSWNWQGCEGKSVDVYVFADCDAVVLEINGKEIERKDKTENGVYVFRTTYNSGVVSAKAIKDGKVIGSSYIETEKEPKKIALLPEKSYLTNQKANEDIVIVDVEIQDENGMLCTQDERLVSYSVKGGKILGVGSMNLTSEEPYQANERCVYKGRGLIIIQKLDKNVVLCANSEGLPATEIEI